MSWPKRLKKAASAVVIATCASAASSPSAASSLRGVRQDVDADAERLDLGRGLRRCGTGMPARCSASPSVSPPMPAPTMMTSRPYLLPAGIQRDQSARIQQISKPTVNLVDYGALTKHMPMRVASPLTWQASPFAQVQARKLRRCRQFSPQPIAMRAPAVAVFGAGEFRAAAQLRPAGKALGIIRRPAIPQRGKDVAAADLIAEEMRRSRHHGGVGGLCRHPVDAREMKAADAAGLVAAGAGDVVEPALEAADRADVLQRRAVARPPSQRGDDVGSRQRRDCALALHQAEFRQQVRWRKANRRRRDRGLGQEFFRDQDRAAIELGEMHGIEQPRLELARRFIVRQDARRGRSGSPSALPRKRRACAS